MTYGYTRTFNTASFGYTGFESLQQDSENNADATFMQKLLPNQKFEAPKVDVSALKRDVNKATTDLPDVQRVTANIKADAQAIKGDFKRNWDQAQAKVQETIEVVAEDMGLNPGAALGTIAPRTQTSDAGRIASIGVDMVFAGKGSMVTNGMQGGSAIGDIIGETKKLSKNEAEAVINETHSRLTGGTNSMEKSFGPAYSGSGAEQGPQSKYQYDNFTPEELGDFAAVRMDDQREVKELDGTIAKLEEVEDNHKDVEEHQFDATGNKIEVAAKQGDKNKVTALVGDAHEAQEMITGKIDLTVKSDYSATGVLTFSEGLTSMPKLTVSMSVDLDEETKKALNMEAQLRAVATMTYKPTVSMSGPGAYAA